MNGYSDLTPTTRKWLCDAFYGRDGWRVRSVTAQMRKLGLVGPRGMGLTGKGLHARDWALAMAREESGDE